MQAEPATRIEHQKLRVFEKTFESGTIIFREGDKTSELYVLLEGCVEVIKGNKIIAQEDKRGIYLGEMSLLLGRPRTATLRAASACRFYVVPEERVFQFFNRSPEMALNLARGLARRLTEMNSKCRRLDAEIACLSSAPASVRLPDSEWNLPPEQMSTADKVEYLTQSEIHRNMLHYYMVKVGTWSELEPLTARCRTSPDKLLTVLRDYQRLNLVKVADDEVVYLLEVADPILWDALSEWVKSHRAW